MSWFGDNKDWLLPTIGFGLNAGSTAIQNNTRGDYYDTLGQIRQQEWEDGRQTYDAYRDWMGQSQAAAAANRAASAANARARAAAAGQTEKNRQKAAKKALKITEEYLNKSMGMFEPYRQTGLRLLPQQEKTYSGGLQNLNMLSAYLNRPDQMAKLNMSTSAAQAAPKLPSYMQGGR